MTDQTRRLSLPFLMADQAAKHVTHNEALLALDALVQLVAAESAATQPPADPAEGDCVLVGEGATGLFAGREGAVAAFQAGAWSFHAPQRGWRAYALDRDELLVFDGAAWSPASEPLEAVERLGIGTDADPNNRLAVAGAATLLTHEGAGHQLKLNKAAASDTASLLFQTGFSGRAEIGTMGSDQLQVKVSADGNAWLAAVSVQPVTGHVGIGTSSPADTLHLKSEAAFCSLRLERRNSATRLRHFDGGPDGKDAIFDIDPLPGSAIAAAEIRYFRNMSTSAPSGVRILRGNGTATANTYLSANADSYLNASIGSVGIGTTAPSARLHVAGPVRIGSANAAALPSASGTGAGGLVFVPDAAGGAIVAFSDGASWRRLDDRQPVV